METKIRKALVEMLRFIIVGFLLFCITIIKVCCFDTMYDVNRYYNETIATKDLSILRETYGDLLEAK